MQGSLTTYLNWPIIGSAPTPKAICFQFMSDSLLFSKNSMILQQTEYKMQDNIAKTIQIGKVIKQRAEPLTPNSPVLQEVPW